MDIKRIFKVYFNGDVNFMTPRVFGYTSYRRDDDQVLLIEKSKNHDSTLYGVSTLIYNPKSNETQKIDLSQPFSNLKDANNYIKNITDDMIDKAYKYGEIKKIT